MTRTVGGSGRSDDPSAGFGWHSHIFVLKPAMSKFKDTFWCRVHLEQLRIRDKCKTCERDQHHVHSFSSFREGTRWNKVSKWKANARVYISIYFRIIHFLWWEMVGIKCDLWHFPRLPELANMDILVKFPWRINLFRTDKYDKFQDIYVSHWYVQKHQKRDISGIRCTPQNVPGHQHCNFSTGKHDDKPIGFGGCSIFGDIPQLINIDMTNPAFNRSFPWETMDFPYILSCIFIDIYLYLHIHIYIYIYRFFAWVWPCLNTCSAHEVQEIMDFELGSPCHGNEKWEGQLRCCGACTSLQLLVVFKIWPWDDDGWWSTLSCKQLFNCSLRVKTVCKSPIRRFGFHGFMMVYGRHMQEPANGAKRRRFFVAQLPTTRQHSAAAFHVSDALNQYGIQTHPSFALLEAFQAIQGFPSFWIWDVSPMLLDFQVV